MQLVVNGQKFGDPPYVARGGIGEIFALSNDTLAKVYDQDKRTFERRQKVLALCNSFQNHVAQFGRQRYAFPEHPAYEIAISFDTLAGFSMRNFGKAPTIGELGYDITTGFFRETKGIRFNESSAIDFVYQIFESVDLLHRARIVLGDVNDGNFLYDGSTKRPVIVDIDSVQIGQFHCVDVTEDFMCPDLKLRGTNLAGGYTFDAGTDIFAVAVVCYEFLIGAKPHYLIVNPPRSSGENKDIGVSSIKCFAMTKNYLTSLGLFYEDVPENRTVERRLAWLQSVDRRLFDFFVAVFVRGERNSLVTNLPVSDQRHPAYHFLVESGFKKAVDDIAEERRQLTAASSGTPKSFSPLADSGFRGIIDGLAGKPAAAPLGLTKGAKAATGNKSDPPQLAAFMRQFNLSF